MAYSHPQGLMQSKVYRGTQLYVYKKLFKYVEPQKVAEDEIAHRRQSQVRELQKVWVRDFAKAVNFENQNYTRFIIITNQKVYSQMRNVEPLVLK